MEMATNDAITQSLVCIILSHVGWVYWISRRTFYGKLGRDFWTATSLWPKTSLFSNMVTFLEL